MKGRRLYNKRDSLEADRELRGGRLLKAYRRVGADDAARMGGVIVELERSKDIPPVKVATGLRAFIFDPRLVDRRVNSALIAGFRIARLVASLEDEIKPDAYPIGYDSITLLPRNRRTLLLNPNSDRLRGERAGFYRILDEEGIKGFTGDGRRTGHRPELPAIAIANFDQPMAKSDENGILNAIDTALLVNLRPQGDPQIGLGELEVRTYMPH